MAGTPIPAPPLCYYIYLSVFGHPPQLIWTGTDYALFQALLADYESSGGNYQVVDSGNYICADGPPPYPVNTSPPPPPPGPPPPTIPTPPEAPPYNVPIGAIDEIVLLMEQIARLTILIEESSSGGSQPGCGCDAPLKVIGSAIGNVVAALLLIYRQYKANPGGNPDPVTCAQLTDLVASLILALAGGANQVATAIASIAAKPNEPNVKRIADALNGGPLNFPGAEAQVAALLNLAVSKYGSPPISPRS